MACGPTFIPTSPFARQYSPKHPTLSREHGVRETQVEYSTILRLRLVATVGETSDPIAFLPVLADLGPDLFDHTAYARSALHHTCTRNMFLTEITSTR